MSKRKLLRARAGEARQRLGRSAHADDRRHAPPRLHAGSRSARSAIAIGVAKRENVVDVALLEHAVREDLNQRAPRVMGVLRPLRVVIENYPEGQVGRGRRRQQSRRIRRPARARCRSRAMLYIEQRRLPGGSAEEVLPAGAGPRSAAALRLLHHLHRRREGPGDRRDRRAALHLRSGDARRRRARRPEGEGDAALGVGRARGRRRGPALRSAVQRRRAGRARRLPSTTSIPRRSR